MSGPGHPKGQVNVLCTCCCKGRIVAPELHKNGPLEACGVGIDKVDVLMPLHDVVLVFVFKLDKSGGQFLLHRAISPLHPGYAFIAPQAGD